MKVGLPFPPKAHAFEVEVIMALKSRSDDEDNVLATTLWMIGAAGGLILVLWFFGVI